MKKRSTERGTVLIAFLVLMALGLVLIANALNVSSTSGRSILGTRQRSEHFYVGESGQNQVLSWVRENSQYLVSSFKDATFSQQFTRTSPSYGANDTGLFRVPTNIKLRGTNNSAILVNDNSLATAAYPALTNVATGATLNPLTQFAAANFGTAKVRVTLVDAEPLDPTKDSPPLAAAATDYIPVYRVDAMTGTDRGSHVYGYISGNLYYVDTIGFYGQDFVQVSQDCTSATFTANNPGPTNAKCPVGSNGHVNIANNAKVYGSARSNGTVAPPNKVCADYPSCVHAGSTCQGTSCAVPPLPTFQTWAQYCPTTHGNFTVNANQNLILITPGCYDTVTINNKGSLTLQDTTTPYYFKQLTIVGGNPQTQLKVAPSPNTGTVQLYLKQLTGDTLNGNQAVNSTVRPSQFRIYYLGDATDPLILNGNANMSFALVSPYAGVTLQGNSSFYGGITAKSLTMTGSSTAIYDETLGGRVLNDVTFRLRQIEERYR